MADAKGRTIEENRVLLVDAAEWLIINHAEAIAGDERAKIQSAVIDKFLVQVWNQPIIRENIPFMDIRLKAGGVWLTAQKVISLNGNASEHALWIFKTSYRDWVENAPDPSITFRLTTGSEDGQVEIVKQMDTLPMTIEWPGGYTHTWSADDLPLRYYLETPYYPAAFPELSDADVPIGLTKDGTYVKP